MTGMTENGGAYEQLVEAAVRREMDVLGDDRAVAIANEIDGLAVDETGVVATLDRSGTGVMHDLVDRYIDASGEVAAFVIARKLENVIPESDAPDLPENVARHL